VEWAWRNKLEALRWIKLRYDSFLPVKVLGRVFRRGNLGHDADTTAAVYGQLAGAFYGEDEIPEEWRQKLAQVELIKSFAESLFRHRVME